MVQVSLTVGKLDTSLALLLTENHHLIEFPTLLLPNNVKAGSIVKITCDRDLEQEAWDKQALEKVQDEILSTFGIKEPKPPVLRVRNVTQTSVVLEWDPIDVATAGIISLVLYKNSAKFGAIPTPLKRTATKLSGLAIDTAYTFRLKLSTTAGVYESDHVTVKTHKMTDLTGITICVGSLKNSLLQKSDLEAIVSKINAKPLQEQVKLDTTHFICTKDDQSAQIRRAQDLNIPVVQPEWLQACEAERRLVGVRAYYLDADPKLRPPLPRSRAESRVTAESEAQSDYATVDDVVTKESIPAPITKDEEPEQKQEQEPEAEAEAATHVSNEAPVSEEASSVPESVAFPVPTISKVESPELAAKEDEDVLAAPVPVSPTPGNASEFVPSDSIQVGSTATTNVDPSVIDLTKVADTSDAPQLPEVLEETPSTHEVAEPEAEPEPEAPQSEATEPVVTESTPEAETASPNTETAEEKDQELAGDADAAIETDEKSEDDADADADGETEAGDKQATLVDSGETKKKKRKNKKKKKASASAATAESLEDVAL